MTEFFLAIEHWMDSESFFIGFFKLSLVCAVLLFFLIATRCSCIRYGKTRIPAPHTANYIPTRITFLRGRC